MKCRGSTETFITNISSKLNIKCHIERRIEVEKIVRSCMHVRNDIKDMYRILKLRLKGHRKYI